MRVGVQMIFQSWGYDQSVTDGEVVAEEIRLGELADELGFHALWPVEHHFNDYSFCPDNTVFLAHMAARTKRILLGTGAVILPWNEPLRVAEKIALLDHLSDGRVLFGVPWLGKIPAHWKILRAKYVFREIDERSTTGEETHLSMSQRYGLIDSSRIEDWRLQSESQCR